MLAAGVAFYAFLAIVPLLAVTVLFYGLVANMQTVGEHVQRLAAILPADVAALISDQLVAIVSSSDSKKGVGLLVAIAIALFGARNAAGSIVTALNAVYGEREKRGFIHVNLLAIAITLGAALTAALGLAGVGAMGFMRALMARAPSGLVSLSTILTYVALALAAAFSAAVLYRYGPSRDQAGWRWINPGALLFAGGWVLLTIGFGIYVARFGSYGATYGSLSAVVVLLTWIWLSAYALLFGAELNAELEHQTARDTTRGAEEPMGQRGAWAADNVASSSADLPS